jgi:hypothetical protein
MKLIELCWAIVGPLLGIVAAWKLFKILLLRIDQKAISISKAFRLYLVTLSFPIVFLIIVAILSTICNIGHSPRMYWMGSLWNGDGALGPFFLGAGLLGVMFLFNIAFWLALLFLPDRTKVSDSADKSVDNLPKA